MRTVQIHEIKSPCRKCEDNKPNCRKNCIKLIEFYLETKNKVLTFGIADTTDDGYRLLLH